MSSPSIIDVEEVIDWLGPGHDPDIVAGAHRAAEAWVLARVRWWAPGAVIDGEYPEAPEDIKQAVRFQTARYVARRNSPDGMVGLADLGGIAGRIPITDQDVSTLINPWRPVAFG